MDGTAGCAIVTGASRGFGLAIARALAERGQPVAIAARDREPLERAAEEIRATGADALACASDVTSDEDVDRLVRAALARFGRIDVLVNNAGAPPLLERFGEGLSWERWRRHLDVDLRGVFNGCRRVVPVMRGQGTGTIVNVASGAVVAASPLHLAYTPAQLAIVGFSRCLAADLGDAGIAVHCLCPDLSADGDVGRTAAEAFGALQGIELAEWLARSGPKPPSTARAVGEAVPQLIGTASGVWHVGGAGLAAWNVVAPPPRSP